MLGRWLKRTRVTSRRPRLALVTCARNEASWLPAFLRYHHAVGVEKAYVFLHACTDASAAIARSFPWTEVFSISADHARHFTYIADLHCACMNHSLRLARQQGFDWLLTIDADEFACGDNGVHAGAVERAHLLPLLQRVKPETVQIRLPTREVVPMRLPAGAPFWRQRFFQSSPRLTWDIHDPQSGRHDAWHDFVGHRQGKSMVRTAADVQAYDSHRWVPAQAADWPDRPEFAPLPTEDGGYHYHFYVTSHRHWLEKFPKQAFEPDVWFCGTAVELPKLCWRRLASRMPAEELEGYFDRWIARPLEELQSLTAQGLLAEDTGVIEVLRAVGALHDESWINPGDQTVGPDPKAFVPSDGPEQVLPVQPPCSWSAAKIPASQRRGFHALEASGREYFRWTEPRAAVQFPIQPGDYRIGLDMKHLGQMWAGQLTLRLNEQLIPCRGRRFEAGVLSQIICRQDFPLADTRWLEFESAELHTTSWPVPDPRPLGTPVFRIVVDRC